MNRQYRYPWPSSKVSRELMELLYRAREQSLPRKPITALLAMAVRATYGQMESKTNSHEHQHLAV